MSWKRRNLIEEVLSVTSADSVAVGDKCLLGLIAWNSECDEDVIKHQVLEPGVISGILEGRAGF